MKSDHPTSHDLAATAAAPSSSAPNTSRSPRRRRRDNTTAAPPLDQWDRMVAEAAYFRAEKRGFVGGSPEEDWYAAEAELRNAARRH